MKKKPMAKDGAYPLESLGESAAAREDREAEEKLAKMRKSKSEDVNQAAARIVREATDS